MDLVFIASGLSAAVGGFDGAILQWLHGLAEWGGALLTPLCSVVSFIGEQGIAMFVMALVLMAFRSTRKIGVCVLLAVCLGALMTNVILKDLVARPRPFEDASGIYHQWWQFVGSPEESGYSFPSGHVTAAMAGMTALFLSANKRIAWVGFLYVVLMALSRNYLMVHYPSDVLAAVLIGATAAIAAYYCVQAVLGYAEKNRFGWYYRWFAEPLRVRPKINAGQQVNHARSDRSPGRP